MTFDSFLMRKLVFILLLTMPISASAQVNAEVVSMYSEAFADAYRHFPEIPRGVLEATAYSLTDMHDIHADEPPSCVGLPRTRGLFALVEDGQGYFRNNLQQVADLSGTSKEGLLSDTRSQIRAFAAAMTNVSPNGDWNAAGIAQRIMALSALPMGSMVHDYARSVECYGVMRLLTEPAFMRALSIEPLPYSILQDVFGENLPVLSASKVVVDGDRVHTEDGHDFERGGGIAPCYNYAADVYTQTPSCNYSSRAGTAVSAVTIHTIQGNYAGAISWAQNCDANVSFHYVVRRGDGQITQMLCEADKGWHVGSENPYTIGIEHEGYVTDANNYTTAMYQATANLVRDITNSGYGISPVRTSYFPWAPTTNYNATSTPGSCVRIKGHQHFPNQTHTDPGQYWDWDYFHKLMNPNTPVTVLNSATGDFFDSGGQIGVYGNDERTLTLIQPANGGAVAVTFSQFDVENNWDYLYIYDGTTVFSPLIGYYSGTNSPGTLTSNSGHLLFEFRSDCSSTNPGWAASWTSNAPDNVAPNTDISQHSWETQDFTTTFTDTDNNGGSGIDRRFWQMMDFDGTEWRANGAHGFINDNFLQTSIHPDWTQVSGNWAVNGGYLVQSNESNGNSNIHLTVAQNAQHSYLYHWGMHVSGAGTNRRAGIHFFCDNPALENRGNGYFVYYRVESSKCQIYKVVNNAWTLMSNDDLTFNANTWYDLKVIFDPSTGLIQAYCNDVLASEWTDPSPHQSGNAISLRTADCNVRYNDVKVYRSRNTGETVSVGPLGMARYQNPSPSQPAGRIRTLVRDAAGNWSSSVAQDVNIDWTAPVLSALQDGPDQDIDETQDGTQLEANWGAAVDPNSGVSHYLTAMGDAPGAVNIATWTNVGNALSITVPHTLTPFEWYYAQLKSVNNAGLETTPTISNGQQYVPLTVGLHETESMPLFPNPTTGIIHLPDAQGMMVEILDATGRRVGLLRNTSSTVDLRTIVVSEGIYLLKANNGATEWTYKVVLVKP
jgi:hypothetical protein